MVVITEWHLIFSVFFGFIFCMGLKYFWKTYQNRRWPMVQLIIKEVGETMPRPILTRCRRSGNLIISKMGYVKSQFEWKYLLSDMIDLTYWKSMHNVYPCLWKESFREKIIKFKKRPPFFHLFSRAKPKMALTDGKKTEKIDPEKTKATDEAFYVHSAHFSVMLSKVPADLKVVVDESIRPVVVELWKANALRFTWKDWVEKWTPVIYPVLTMIIVIMFFIMVNRNTGQVVDAVKTGIKITIEGRIPEAVVKVTPTPPPGFGG